MQLTKHAAERMQQRGIPPLIMRACIDYGSSHHAGSGSTLYCLDKKSKRRLEREWGRSVIKKLSGFLDGPYVIVGPDGVIMTTGKRFKRIRSK